MMQPAISFTWGPFQFTISERALTIVLAFVLVVLGLPQMLPL